jgi:alanyl-tRNA synthetase
MTSTGKVGPLRIVKTERIQDGVERFEFAAGIAAILYDQERDAIVSKSSKTLRVPPEQLPSTTSRFFEEWKELGKENEKLREQKAKFVSESPSIKKAQDALNAGDLNTLRDVLSSLDAAFKRLTNVAVTVDTVPNMVAQVGDVMVSTVEQPKPGIKVYSMTLIDANMKELLRTSQELLNDNAVVILGGVRAGKANIVIMMRTDVVKKGLNAAMIVKEVCSILGGRGGGRPERAQGGGPYADKINEAVNQAKKLVREKLEAIGQAG